MSASFKLALIGAGRMGGALASGWLRGETPALRPENLVIVDPRPGEAGKAVIEQFGLTRLDHLDQASAAGLDLIVLAVKPQGLSELARSLAPALDDKTGLLSIMAGPTIAQLADAFGPRPIVRAMPNTPAAVGEGVSVMAANPAGRALQAECDALMQVGGLVEWVRDEKLLGAVTAVSGSGPAYVFLLTEALAAAGEAEGLSRDLAAKLARQTVIGAAALLKDTGEAPQTLRRGVTSPGGTTQAALDVLIRSGGGLPELVRQAVQAAERRSRQLASS